MQKTKKIQKVKSKTVSEKETHEASKKKLNLDNALVQKAFDYISTWKSSSEKETNNLFAMGDNPFVYLTVLVNELPTKIDIKPSAVDLKHSIYGQDFNTKCFFITTNKFKADNKGNLEEFKGRFKFVSYDQFKNKYHEYKDRLALLKEYDLFFCDSRIYSILKKHCGAHFYRQKKYPYPVDFAGNFEADSEKIEASKMDQILTGLLEKKTYFVQANGPEYSLKVGRTKECSGADVISNSKAGLKAVLSLLMERGLKLSNLRRVSLKGEKTENFPLFSHLNSVEKKSLERVVKNKSIKMK